MRALIREDEKAEGIVWPMRQTGLQVESVLTHFGPYFLSTIDNQILL